MKLDSTQSLLKEFLTAPPEQINRENIDNATQDVTSIINTVCKSLRFFGLTGCIFCDPSKHKKYGSVKVRLDSGRQSCDS